MTDLSVQTQTLIFAGQRMENDRQMKEYHVPPVRRFLWDPLHTFSTTIGYKYILQLVRYCMGTQFMGNVISTRRACLFNIRYCDS